LNVFGGPWWLQANLEVTRANLRPALELMADVLRNPSFDSEEFRQLVDETLVDLEQSKTDPGDRSFVRLNRHLYPYPPVDPRATHTPEERIEMIRAVDIAQMKEFFATFYGGSFGELAVVGDFEASEVEPLLGTLFGDWKTTTKHERIVSEYQDRPAIVERIQIPDKESAMMGAGLRVAINQDDPDYPAMVLGGYMLGGGFLNSRLATRIRQEEGLSYSVGARFGAPPVGNDARLNAFAAYAPQNDGRLVEAFQDEMRKAAEVPFTTQEVEEAKSGWLQRQQVSRSNDSELAGDLTNQAYNDRTMEWQAKLEASIRELTPEQIFMVMQKHIIPTKVSVVRAGDFEKAAAETPAESSSSSLVD
jgi:zinc protease